MGRRLALKFFGYLFILQGLVILFRMWPFIPLIYCNLSYNGSYKIPLVATAKREQGHAFPIRRLISQRSLMQLYSGKGSSLAIYKQQILNT
jgi:hypothetical protein